jgi:hypothetical protein
MKEPGVHAAVGTVLGIAVRCPPAFQLLTVRLHLSKKSSSCLPCRRGTRNCPDLSQRAPGSRSAGHSKCTCGHQLCGSDPEPPRKPTGNQHWEESVRKEPLQVLATQRITGVSTPRPLSLRQLLNRERKDVAMPAELGSFCIFFFLNQLCA